MTEGWPVTPDGKFPQYFLNKNVQGSYDPNAVIRSQMEIGTKSRRRDTSVRRSYSGSILLTVQQFVEVFQPWYEDSLGYGVLPFQWKDPYTDVLKTFVFVDHPVEDYQEGGLIILNLPLKEVPT